MLYLSLLLYIVVQSLCQGNFIVPIAEVLFGKAEDDHFNLSVYHPFHEIMDHLYSLQSRYPELVQVEKIGTTYENNTIKGVKISRPCKDKLKPLKPAIWIDSGIHAREWVTPATSLYIIDHLVKGYDTDSDIQQLVDTYDWYIFPVLNPDGYKYSWSTKDRRLWRKNRSPNTENCNGTDLNRNFGVGFQGSGNSSTDPCSDYYVGKSPFSELETQAVGNKIWKMRHQLKLVITLHSFSQLWMSPYGYTEKLPPDHEDHMKVLNIAVSTIKNFSGKIYTPGAISEVLYVTPGSSIDWVYEEAKVKYSFTVEMRDTGEYGFELPPDFIIPTASENWEAIKAVARYLKDGV